MKEIIKGIHGGLALYFISLPTNLSQKVVVSPKPPPALSRAVKYRNRICMFEGIKLKMKIVRAVYIVPNPITIHFFLVSLMLLAKRTAPKNALNNVEKNLMVDF